MALISKRFVLPVTGQHGHPNLLVTAKRYTRPSSTYTAKGYTLLLTHGVSFHKELWEPSLSQLFALAHLNSQVQIREAWVIDCPSHGESAALNDYIQKMGYLITFQDYARAIIALLASGLVDLTPHSIVGIGHSAGSAALANAIDIWSRRTHKTPFRSLVLIDPPMISAELDVKYHHFNAALAAKALSRRSDWSSREEAAQWLKQRQHFWDPRCLKIFTEYGLRNTRPFSREVSLSCTGTQEAACYNVEQQEESLATLRRLCSVLPVHTIFAEFNDLLPHFEIRENVVDERKGRKMASVTHMRNVGHFAPFQNPEICAQAILHCLYLSNGHPAGATPGRVEARL